MPRSFRIAAAAMLLAGPALAPAQPVLTDVTLFNATFQGEHAGGFWNTRPGDGAFDVFLSPDDATSFVPANVLNPGATLSHQLPVGVSTLYYYASTSFTNFLGLNLFFDGATTPDISGFFSFGTGTDPNSAACTLTPTITCTPGAGTLSFATGGYTVTLVHTYLADAAGNGGAFDRVSPFTVGPDGSLDNHGRMVFTVTRAANVPEPSTWVLVGTGGLAVAGVAAHRRRR
jgi:PEP-CTERM motif